MKVLCIANYSEMTGWSYFAQNQIRALDKAGVDVVCRPLFMLNGPKQTHPRLQELEKKSASDADIVIQNTLPHLMEYHGRFRKNIGYYLTETSNFQSSSWAKHINQMDEAWTPCEANKEASLGSLVDIPLRVIPTAIDTEQFQRSYDPPQFWEPFKDKFVFYTVGEFSRRKNIGAIIKAFNTEFSRQEPVELFIKTTPTNLPGNPLEYISKFITDIKTGLKLYKNAEDYKQEAILCQHLPEEQVLQIHNVADCFVTTSLGESVCLPAQTALGFGNPVICPAAGGFLEYMTPECGWLLPTRADTVFGAMDTLDDLYTARETWETVSVVDLMKAMRSAYEDRELYQEKSSAARERVYDFSLRKVGEKIREVLE